MGFLKKYPAIVLGAGITLLFLALSFGRIGFFESLELKFYDLLMSQRDADPGTEQIAIVEIDDDSLDRLGRWPWPRSLIARGIDKINEGGARLIGLNVIFSEPEESSGIKQVRLILDMVRKSPNPDQTLLRALESSLTEMDNDTRLQEALEGAGNVILPVFIKENPRIEDTGEVNDPALVGRSITDVETAGPGTVPSAEMITTPLTSFMEAAEGIGHVNLFNDIDGVVRSNPLILRYRNLYFPSFALKLAALSLDVPNRDIRVDVGNRIDLGTRVSIPVTSDTRLLVSFKGGTLETFRRYSFFDVINDKIPLSNFQNRIVLITPTAVGVGTVLPTPVSPGMDMGGLTANTIWTLLNQQFIRQPSWNATAGLAMILLVGVLITLVLPRLKAALAGVTFIVVMGLIVGVSYYFFTGQGLWVRIIYPFLQLLLGYIGVVTINFFVTEAGKEKIEGESAETNRMLGLSFQSQGMLDMAFDKLRKVPVDNETKDILYNLALDYERKRQFNKAASVYEHIEKHDPNYKNVGQRKERLLQASETMVFGDGMLGGTSGDSLLSGGGGTRPTLGRYEVIKQLGKGAMGVVYLGQDPRINRTTAIKTFKFTEDFEPEEAEKMKQKFFREAESAGTLSHPNIVTIYDAGDEHDLAYIAMEYLEGEDLQKFTKKKNLLPLRKVIDYVADVAEGLDYAHEKGIVHRDIKPANIMLLKSGIIKITDFGIARITASSQTQTGVVKGTPHYMSPEQISGKKVDGKSDIFSLGTMLYQMVTGELPFRGDSPAALMHQIMNVRQPDPRTINPKVVKPLVAIINKALEKDPSMRYQRALLLAKHLRQLGAKIDAIMAQKRAAKASGA